ncbi:MAG: hypothetical protein AAGJ97_14825, partial [Planctomycetota bacterium]
GSPANHQAGEAKSVRLATLNKADLVEIAVRHEVDQTGTKDEVLARLKEKFGTEKYDPVNLTPWVEPEAE